MKIGILECGHTIEEVEENHGSFPQMFERLLAGNNFSYEVYDVENMSFPKDVHVCDGWLLTGSRHGAYEGHAFIAPLEEFIRNAYAQSVPLVGICFGHQIIAQALGGKVEKFKEGWALGLNQYDFNKNGKLSLNAWHQDQVVQRPKDATVIASNSFCENAALVYGNKAMTIQPHPEFHGGIVSQYVDIRRGSLDYPDKLMDEALNHIDRRDDNQIIAQEIADFFKSNVEKAVV